MGSGPTDKKVTFARDETSLLAQLKALVLEFETGSKGNLLSKLRQLVERFGQNTAQDKPLRKVASGTGDRTGPPTWGRKSAQPTLYKPPVLAMLPKFTKA